jgi:hypothetical protein
MLMLCPICAGEFETFQPVCPGCDCELVPGTLKTEVEVIVESSEKREVEFVELCRPQTHPEAMLIKQTLEQNDVAVLIRGLHSISVMPHLAFGGQLRLLVARDQFDYAQALYKAYFESEETDYIVEE